MVEASRVRRMHARVERPRKLQLIEAAGELFRANGFRAVTMEAVAAHAQVAKATLYSYFPDKETLFAAVAVEVTDRIADALRRELAAGGPLDERLTRALVTRHKMVFDLVDGSPHARELMYTRDLVARAPVLRTDAAMIAALEAALREDAVLAKQAGTIAMTLFFGAVGVSHHARSIEQVEREVGDFVRPYLAGVRLLALRRAGKTTRRIRGKKP
jgi:AcrR family transcriptional regulator